MKSAKTIAGNLEQSQLQDDLALGFALLRQFYVMFQDRKPEIHYPSGSELTSNRKRYPAGGELSDPEKRKTKEGKSLIGFHPNLSWSHYRALIRMYEEHGKVEGDNPTIGLILCSEKNEAIARYSVLNESKQLFASKYMLYLPTEEELQHELERGRRLIEERRRMEDDNDQVSD